MMHDVPGTRLCRRVLTLTAHCVPAVDHRSSTCECAHSAHVAESLACDARQAAQRRGLARFNAPRGLAVEGSSNAGAYNDCAEHRREAPREVEKDCHAASGFQHRAQTPVTRHVPAHGLQRNSTFTWTPTPAVGVLSMCQHMRASATQAARQWQRCTPKDTGADGIEVDCKHVGELAGTVAVEEGDWLHKEHAEDLVAHGSEHALESADAPHHIKPSQQRLHCVHHGHER